MSIWGSRNVCGGIESVYMKDVLLEELGVLGLLPVKQILQVVNEGSLPQDASLSQNWRHKHAGSQDIRICQVFQSAGGCVSLVVQHTLVKSFNVSKTLSSFSS